MLVKLTQGWKILLLENVMQLSATKNMIAIKGFQNGLFSFFQSPKSGFAFIRQNSVKFVYRIFWYLISFFQKIHTYNGELENEFLTAVSLIQISIMSLKNENRQNNLNVLNRYIVLCLSIDKNNKTLWRNAGSHCPSFIFISAALPNRKGCLVCGIPNY